MLAQHARFYPNPRDPDELLTLVGLSEKAGERVKRLSGGQQRRLDLALGMVGNPELIFLDEPTTGFDPQARRQAWDIVRRLADGGTTVVLTTHYLDEAQALADRVVVFARGQVVERARPTTSRRARGSCASPTVPPTELRCRPSPPGARTATNGSRDPEADSTRTLADSPPGRSAAAPTCTTSP